MLILVKYIIDEICSSRSTLSVEFGCKGGPVLNGLFVELLNFIDQFGEAYGTTS